MLTGSETNTRRVIPDEHGPALINRLAAEINAIDCHAIVPNDPRAARALLQELQARHVPRETASDRRYAEASQVYNGALRDLARAKRPGLFPADYRLPPPGDTPDALRELRDAVGELDERLSDYDAKVFRGVERTPEQLRIVALERKLRETIEHFNKQVAELSAESSELKAKLARFEGILALGPRLVQPAL